MQRSNRDHRPDFRRDHLQVLRFAKIDAELEEEAKKFNASETES